MCISYTLTRYLRRTALQTQQVRWETTMTNLTQEEIDLRPPLAQWSKVIKEAEKIVGYPTSFMNLRWLLSDEFANMALYLRKLVGSNHPILQTAKNVLYSEHNNLKPWGLIILLLSKSVKDNFSSSIPSVSPENSTFENQRILAELTEMIRTGHLVHRGLINVPLATTNNTDTAMFGNKIALLIGDYLLVTANGMLARLRNQDLSYLISSALRDLSEGEFFGDRDNQNIPYPGRPLPKTSHATPYKVTVDTSPLTITDVLGYSEKEWTVRSLFGGATLLGRGCQGAMLLDKKSIDMQKHAYLFGCHLGLAWQATTDLQRLDSDSKEQLSLVSAPVLFAIDDDPGIYEVIADAQRRGMDVNFEELKQSVLRTEAMERTKVLREQHAKEAKQYLDLIGENESTDAIKRLINSC